MSESPKHRTAMIKIVGEHALDFTSAVYGDLLDILEPQVRDGDWHSNPLIVPFVFTCAAALEATLNDHLVAFCFSRFGEGKYRRVAEGHLTMSFRGKLTVLVPLLTDGRFVVKTDSQQFQSLSQLITDRNELVHSTSYFAKAAKWSDEEGSELLIDASFREKMDSRRLRSLAGEDCQQYYKAFRALSDLFLYPLERGELAPNSLVQYAR